MMTMAGSGRPPIPSSRRQTGNQAHTWTDLPAGGYTGPVPKWPFPDATPRELEVWGQTWRKPHGAAWARYELDRDVAMYVRHGVRGENGDLEEAKEARMWSDRIGLNPQAMLRNRWRVTDDVVAERRKSKPAKSPATKRMRVVADDDVESA